MNMNGSMKRTDFMNYCVNYEEKQPMEETCNFSGYSMMAMAGGLLLCLGIILYAFLTV